MKSISVQIPVSCKLDKVETCRGILYSQKSISSSLVGPLLAKQLVIYLPEGDMKTEELIEIGIIVGVYIH